MADSEPTLPTPAEDDGLQRTTTMAIVIRMARSGWQIVGAGIAFAVFSGIDQGFLALVFAGLILLALVGGVFSWLSWSRFRYGVVDGHLVIHEGLLVRRRRSIPIARVQGIDIKADLLMRILGLVEVTVQTAGGGASEPEASIVGVPLGEAERLRGALLHDRTIAAAPHSAGTSAAIGGDPLNRMSDVRGLLAGDEVDFERPSFEYQLTLPRLFLAGATSSQVFISFFVVVGVAGQLFSMAGARAYRLTDNLLSLALPFALLSGFAVIGLVMAGSVTASVIADFGFTSRRVGDRIETERGLIERRMVGLPVGRIQAVRIQSTPLRRLMGFSAIHVDTAGFGSSEENGKATAALVPLARRAELRRLLHGLLPELEEVPAVAPLPRRSLSRYLFLPMLGAFALGLPPAGFFLGAWLLLPLATSLLALIPAALAWRGAGLGVDKGTLVLRNGILGSTHVRIPRSRLQSLSLSQNPFQKRAGLATLAATIVSGSSGATHRVRHIDAGVAWSLIAWFSHAPVETVSHQVDDERTVLPAH